MRVAALTILAMSAASLAHAQEAASPSPPSATTEPWNKEPDGYRGLKWGTTVAGAADVLDSADSCLCMWGGDDNSLCKAKAEKDPEKDPKKVPPKRSCSTTFDVGPVKVKDRITFVNDTLAAASMSFDADEYEKLRDIFIDKYGPPTSSKNTEVKNRMGATFQQETLEWKGTTAAAMLRRYGSKLTEGFAMISTKAYLEQSQTEIDAEKKKGSKAF